MSSRAHRLRFASCFLLALVAILALAAKLYWPGLDGPFLLDDTGNISVLEATEFSVDAIYHDVSHNRSGLLGRPASLLSLSFTNIVHGPSAWGFKYHNLMLHLINGLLIFWLTLKLLPRLAPGCKNFTITAVAAIASAIWLLHPLMVSTVLYAVQRMAQLSAFFSLAALLSYVFMRESIDTPRLHRLLPAVGLFLLFTATACLSKENGCLVLLYVVLIESIAYRYHCSTPVARTRLLAFHGLIIVLPLLAGAAYFLSHLEQFTAYSSRDYSMWNRVMTQFHVLLFYTKLVLAPAVSDMSLFHDGWPAVREFDFVTGILGIFWTMAASAVVLLRRRAPVVAFGIGWFLISHLLESTIIDLELVFEHRNYLAAAGLLLIPVYYALVVPGYRQGVLLPLLALPLLVFMTHARVKEWQDDELIYSIAVLDHPESIRALTGYATILYGKGNVEQAIDLTQRAIALDDTEFANIILNVLLLCGRGHEEEIDTLLVEATRRAGLYAATPYSFSALDRIAEQMQKGRCPDVEPRQVLALIQAAAGQEDNLANRAFTGYLQRHEGIFHYFQGNLNKGFEKMVQAYENTGLSSILLELITIQGRFGYLESAEHLLGMLEEVNRERMGSETLTVEKAKARLQEARRIAADRLPPQDSQQHL